MGLTPFEAVTFLDCATEVTLFLFDTVDPEETSSDSGLSEGEVAPIVVVLLVVLACGIVVVIAVILGHRKYKGEFFHLLQLLVLPGRMMRTEALGE